MNESACSFGDDSSLTGVYTPSAAVNSDKPCVLYLTAGLLHHIGPTRMHVEMSRALAMDGVAGFRFDLSGVGDSETNALGGYFLDRSVKEVNQAMDFMQKAYGHQSFVLMGLCSGADDALATAIDNTRVVGIVLLNGYAYRAGYFKLFRFIKFYIPRLFMPEKIMRMMKRLLNRRRTTPDLITADDQLALDELDSDYRYVPPRQQTESQLASLAEQQTDMLLIYTGGEHNEYSYKGQLFAMFPRLRNNIHVHEYYAQPADHTFILEEDRVRLIEKVRAWYAQATFQRNKDIQS